MTGDKIITPKITSKKLEEMVLQEIRIGNDWFFIKNKYMELINKSYSTIWRAYKKALIKNMPFEDKLEKLAQKEMLRAEKILYREKTIFKEKAFKLISDILIKQYNIAASNAATNIDVNTFKNVFQEAREAMGWAPSAKSEVKFSSNEINIIGKKFENKPTP